MALDPKAVRAADEKLWAAHPELGGRRLTGSEGDSKYRAAWNRFYKEESEKKPPAAKEKPKPAPPPPEPDPVGTCAPPKKKTVKKCKDVSPEVKEGDVVLRSTPGDDSDLIRSVAKCGYSHAGIVAKDSKGDLVVVDAYPGRTNGDVKTETVDEFFCGHGTMKGIVARPKDCDTGEKAAQWAMEQTKETDYTFDLFNPWNGDPKQLYCSDFVYQSYGAAGATIVPDKMDFLAKDNKENTLDTLREFVKKNYKEDSKEARAARWAPDFIFERIVKSQFGGSEYITPCQVAFNDSMDTAVEYQP